MSASFDLPSSAELSALYRSRRLSPVEVARAVLARIDAAADLNGFTVLDPDATLAAAAASEARWFAGVPLGTADGLPVSVRDGMAVRGWPTPNGSLTTDPDDRATFDSPSVARLREAGGVFVGKTATPEFGWKGVTDSPLRGVTRNPWNPDLTPGGSSGGAGVAAALDLGIWHTASDAAGSIRIPAAFCGVVGFKPTFGVVPLYPSSVFTGLTTHGCVGRSVAEIDAMLAVIAKPDARDPTAAPAGACTFGASSARDIVGTRIGLLRSGGIAVEPEILAAVEAAARVLEGLGAVVEPAEFDLSEFREICETVWRVGCGLRVAELTPAQRDVIDPGLLHHGALGEGIGADRFRTAQLRAEALSRELQLLLAEQRMLLLPTVPIGSFEAGRDFPAGRGFSSWLDWSPFTPPFNFSQNPAISVPCGLSGAGLPLAFQLVGRRFDDGAVLGVAAAYEAAWPGPRPPRLRALPGIIKSAVNPAADAKGKT